MTKAHDPSNTQSIADPEPFPSEEYVRLTARNVELVTEVERMRAALVRAHDRLSGGRIWPALQGLCDVLQMPVPAELPEALRRVLWSPPETESKPCPDCDGGRIATPGAMFSGEPSAEDSRPSGLLHTGWQCEPTGEVTVVTNSCGDCVAITRTDQERRVLSVIWERSQQETKGDAK
jgi:hypothetical protein